MGNEEITTEVEVVNNDVTTEGLSVDTQGVDQDIVGSSDVRSISPFLRSHYEKQSSTTEEILEEGDKETGEEDIEDPEGDIVDPKIEEEIGPAKIKISDDLEATPEEIAEWKNGYMMQADYTRKTQELAREREDFTNKVKEMENNSTIKDALDLWDNLARDPIGILNALREHYEEQGITEPRDPEVVKAEIERDKATRENNQLKTSEARRIFNEHMDSLVDKYGDDGFDRGKVLEYCIKYNIPDPETAWMAMREPLASVQEANSKTKALEDRIAELEGKLAESIKNTEEEGKKAVSSYVKNKIERSANFVPPIGSGNSGAAVTATVPKTFREAKLSAMNRLGAK